MKERLTKGLTVSYPTTDKAKLTFKMNGENFGKFRIDDKGKRMKLRIKLDKAETEQWKVLKEALTGGELSDDTLARVMFFKGITTITQELNERVENMTDEEKEKVLEGMTDTQADAAMHMAEEEFAGDDESTEETND